MGVYEEEFCIRYEVGGLKEEPARPPWGYGMVGYLTVEAASLYRGRAALYDVLGKCS